MIFAQTLRYRGLPDAYSINDQDGASVAHAGFLTAVLQHGDLEAVYLLRPQSAPLSNDDVTSGTALQTMAARVPLHVTSLNEWLTIQSSTDAIVYESGPFITPVAQVRALGGARYPICALAHSLDISSLVCSTWTLAKARPYDAIIVSSAPGRRALLDLLNSSAALRGATDTNCAPQIHHIPLGVDTAYLAPLHRATCRHSLRIGQTSAVLLYVGRFSARHKADLLPLLTAVQVLARDVRDLLLILAGTDSDPSYSKEIECEAQARGLGSQVRIIRNFSPALKPLLYSASDVFVSPVDNVQETFGLSILEAMACALPTVASDWSGYRDIVDHNVTGFLVPTVWNPYAAAHVSRLAPLSDQVRRLLPEQTIVDVAQLIRHIRTLLTNSNLRQEMGKRARERVTSTFDWQIVLRAHASLWAELLAQSRSAATPPAGYISDDYTKRFGHYATQFLSPELVVTAGSDIHHWRTPIETSRAFGSTITQSDAEHVLKHCAAGPITIAQLMSATGLQGMYLIGWMLKRGYLYLHNRQQVS